MSQINYIVNLRERAATGQAGQVESVGGWTWGVFMNVWTVYSERG